MDEHQPIPGSPDDLESKVPLSDVEAKKVSLEDQVVGLDKRIMVLEARNMKLRYDVRRVRLALLTSARFIDIFKAIRRLWEYEVGYNVKANFATLMSEIMNIDTERFLSNPLEITEEEARDFKEQNGQQPD
jgi:hypothetical protein